jgi:membrane protein DedA with SNARE-associated domain
MMHAAHVEPYLSELLARDGAWALFIAQGLGIFGLPIPDELLLILAGGLVRQGDLRGAATLGAAVAGSAAGMTLSYTLGRLGGNVLHHLSAIGKDTIDRTRSWFARSGKWLLLFGYFIPGVRHVTAIVAGSTPLDFPTFCAYAYPGAALWSGAFYAIGYYAGGAERWEHLAILLHAHLLVAAIMLGALALAYLVVSRTPSQKNGSA